MKNFKTIITLGITTLTLTTALADDRIGANIFHRTGPKIVDVEPIGIFIPVGFDDNDNAVAVIDGYLPDTCFRLHSPEVVADPQNLKVMIQPKAFLYPGPCLDVTIPYTQVVSLGAVPMGKYAIATRNGKVTEMLTVKRATKEQPDDYLYAPVESAQVEKLGGNQLRAILTGRFTNNCSRMDEIKVTNSGKTIEVLPIMKQLEKTESGEPCKKVETSFEEKVMLPEVAPGRHLLHVRSLKGQSVNEVFTQSE